MDHVLDKIVEFVNNSPSDSVADAHSEISEEQFEILLNNRPVEEVKKILIWNIILIHRFQTLNNVGESAALNTLESRAQEVAANQLNEIFVSVSSFSFFEQLNSHFRTPKLKV